MRILLVYLTLFIARVAFAQSDSVAFSKDFSLYEGLYLTYADLRHNWPIPKEKIITSVNKSQLDFYSKLLEQEKIEYIERDGSKAFIDAKKVWGYCQNNVIYINYQKSFFRIPVFGSVCFFIGTVEVVAYSPGYSGFLNSPGGATKVKELREFLLDFNTGELHPFSTDKLLELFKGDKEIYEEYDKLSKKKKKEQASRFIRRYNDKHPIYFPKN